MPTTTAARSLVTARLTIWVRGHVQGVGFRWWARAQATALGLTGTATNLEDGRVEIVVEGDKDSCNAMLDAVRGNGTPGHVTAVAERWGTPKGVEGFRER